MSILRGSSLPIVALAVLFLGLFAWQRSRSWFLAIEADRASAASAATARGLTVPEVMALRELLGPTKSPDEQDAAAASFVAMRRELGDGLAAVAIAGEPAAASSARRADVDAEAAWTRFRTDPRAIAGLRFLAMRDRFASRERSRN